MSRIAHGIKKLRERLQGKTVFKPSAVPSLAEWIYTLLDAGVVAIQGSHIPGEEVPAVGYFPIEAKAKINMYSLHEWLSEGNYKEAESHLKWAFEDGLREALYAWKTGYRNSWHILQEAIEAHNHMERKTDEYDTKDEKGSVNTSVGGS